MHATETSIDPDELARWGLIVLLPDMMRQDVWSPLGERLALLDVGIQGATVCRPAADIVARLYAGNHRRSAERGRIDGSWLGRSLFNMDQSIPLLLRTAVEGLNLSETLHEWKGPSTYGARRPGDLRSVSPMADRCASLFHTPDDIDDFVASVRLLFGGNALEAVVSGRSARPVSFSQVRDLRARVDEAVDTSPYDIVMRTLLRALTLLAVDAHLVPEAALAHVAERVHGARERLHALHGTDLQDAMRDALSDFADVADLPPPRLAVDDVDPVGRTELTLLLHRRSELLQAVSILVAPDRWDARLALVISDIFQANGFGLDDWERHRLTTAITFFGEIRRLRTLPAARSSA
jgi:hypothetical protein